MAKAIRVALPGYNAFTETDPDKFSLITDEDNVLIKEKARGSVSIGAGGSQTISHGLAYIPMVMVFAESADGITGTAGQWFYITGSDSNSGVVSVRITTSDIIISNAGSNTKDAKYYIFYDQQV